MDSATQLTTDIPTQFKDAMFNAGIVFDDMPTADGQLHRFKVNGDKPGSKNGWYVLFGDGNPKGCFGSWKLGTNDTWSLKNFSNYTPQERAEWNKQMADAKNKREKAQAIMYKEARAEAGRLWSNAEPETGGHKYLKDKEVQAYKIRSDGLKLLIPLRDTKGILHSIQTISPDGKKLFLTDGAIQGHYFGIGKPNGKLIICEGYSTGASIYQATGHAVAVAFNAGNLKAAAVALREKLSDIEIIIAGDDDKWTPGNPGLSKAKEAADAVNGKLVIPKFTNTKSRPTDFNDLYMLDGLDEVKQQIESALFVMDGNKKTIVETIEILTKLSELSHIEYEQQREQAAKDLGFRVKVLDQEVKKLRVDESNGAGEGMVFDEPEPWHEQVDGAELLNEITLTLKRFVILPDKAAETIALWIVFTYTFDVMRICPILALTSPEKRCGKTTALSLLLALSNRAMPASNITPPALFRATELWKPTLLIDEADTFLKDNDELRGIVNSGHTRDMAFVIRTVGDDHEPKRFSTWAPKAIAAIGTLKDTLLDRSIVIQMRRKTADEKVERLRNLDVMNIKSRCIRWAQDNEELLKVSDPILPATLHDRAADNWTPLVSIADMAGGDWPELSRKAASALTQADENEDSIKIQLLTDIESIFNPRAENGFLLKHTDKLWTETILEELHKMEERSWSDWKKGKALSAQHLSKLLKTFGIRSKDLKIDGTNKKGYRLEDFNDAFARYLSATPLLASVDAPFSDIQSATPNKQVADKKPPKPAPDKESSGVAGRNGDMGCLEGNNDSNRTELSL